MECFEVRSSAYDVCTCESILNGALAIMTECHLGVERREKECEHDLFILIRLFAVSVRSIVRVTGMIR